MEKFFKWMSLLQPLLLVFFLPAIAASQVKDCFSCEIKVESLDEPLNLEGKWLFTREDRAENSLPQTDLSDWTTVSAPGPWAKAYGDGEVFSVGWYRGHFTFAEELIGKKVVFYVDAYMSKMSVYVDGKEAFSRQGKDTFQRYYSIQPVPVVFEVTKPVHAVSFRIDTPLMVGVYQSPFQLRSYSRFDSVIKFYQIFCGELRYLFAYIFLWTGGFFLLLYWKTRYLMYFVTGMTAVGLFPFYSMPNDVMVAMFDPDILLTLHYPGISLMAFGYYCFTQFFNKFRPRIFYTHAFITATLAICFLVLTISFNLAVFQVLRKVLFGYALIVGFHAVISFFTGYKNDSRVFPAFIGTLIFWLAGLHDALLAVGLIHSTSLIFLGTFAGTFSMMLITANIFAQTFLDNKTLLREVEQINAGLEKTVAERTKNLYEKTQEITAILASLPQGIMEIDRELRVLDNYSDAVVDILNTTEIAHRDISELVFAKSNLSLDEQEQLRAVLSMSIDDFHFTFDANIENLPSEIIIVGAEGKKILSCSWSSITDSEDVVEKIILSLTDVTSQRELEEKSEEFKLRARLMEEYLSGSSKRKLPEFISNSIDDLATIESELASVDFDANMIYRILHTMKGNSRLYELSNIAVHCHSSETALEHGRQTTDFSEFRRAISELNSSVQELSVLDKQVKDKLSEHLRKSDDLDHYILDYVKNLDLASNPFLLKLVNASEYISARRVADHLDAITSETARKIAKPKPKVEIDGFENLFLNPIVYLKLNDWLVHLVGNSMDHGIEPAEVRVKSGKGEAGKITLRLCHDQVSHCLRIDYEDDGCGLNYEKIRERAVSFGFLTESNSAEEVVNSIFKAGFSTAEEVSDISGRGVGMNVILEGIHELNGRIVWRDMNRWKNDLSVNLKFSLSIYLPEELIYMLETEGRLKNAV